MRLWWPLVLLVAASALSGCVECQSGPPVSARGISSAPSSGGDGPATVTLLVTQGAGGSPVAGAAVVFFWSGARVSDFDEAPPPEAGTPGQPSRPDGTLAAPEPRRTLTLMTGSDGTVQARLAEGIIAGAVAAKDGHTQEWIGHFGASDGLRLELPVYQQRMEFWVNGTWELGAVSSGAVTGNNRAWQPQELAVGTDAAGYAARLASVEAHLSWQNAPTGAGDLGIAMGGAEDDPRLYRDDEDNIALGAQSEGLSIGSGEVGAYGLREATILRAGPATDSGILAPQGLDYTLRLALVFDRDAVDGGGCWYPITEGRDDRGPLPGVDAPGAALLLVATVLLAAALAWRRRT